MHIDPEAIRAQAALHGIVLSDDDIVAIRNILLKTKEALAHVRSHTPAWGEAPHGFLPPGFLPDVETET